MSLISFSWYSRYLVSSYVLSIELLSLARLCEVSRAVAMAAANSKTSWCWWTVEKLEYKRLMNTHTDSVRCFFNNTHITGVQVIINTHCRGICNHNNEAKSILALIFPDILWLFNLDTWFFNEFDYLRVQQTKITSSNSFQSLHHHTVYRNFYNILVYFFVSMAMASSVYILPGQSHLTLPIKLFFFFHFQSNFRGFWLSEVYSGFK